MTPPQHKILISLIISWRAHNIHKILLMSSNDKSLREYFDRLRALCKQSIMNPSNSAQVCEDKVQARPRSLSIHIEQISTLLDLAARQKPRIRPQNIRTNLEIQSTVEIPAPTKYCRKMRLGYGLSISQPDLEKY